MVQKVDPFIGSNWGWDEGEDGWGVGLNETLIQNAFLHNRRIDGIVSSLPTSPSDGQAYFLTSDNRVYFRADGSWYGSNVPRGMDFILKSTEVRYEFDGSTLIPVTDTINSEDINYNNSSSGLSSTNVQDAIDEVVEELSGKVDVVAGKQLSTEDYTTAEKNKLSGVVIGATANQTDTYLLDRSNHTGSQPISTVTDLELTLNSKQDVSNLVQNLESPNSTTYLSTQGLAEAFADVMAGESYQGEWDADTNTPTLTSGAGTQGFYYQVSVAGNTNLDGISDWSLGDEVLFDGTVWKKRKNYQSVVSVNGQTGPVVLSASDIGAVSSVGISVPTGLQVSNTPVTSSGTISISLQSGYSIPTTANQTNWTTAYSERNRWDGGATGLVAATGRTSLGLGTAATANVTSSAVDTTLNALVKTGDAGWLGLNSTTITDANLLTVPANYQMGAGASSVFQNFPTWADPSRSTVLVMGNMSPYGTQLYFERTTGRSAMRTHSGSWGAWREFWTDANLVKVSGAVDTTPGRVMTVGSGGWLGLANYQSVYDFDATGQVMQGRTMISISPGTKPSANIPGFPDNCFVLPAQRSSGNNMVQLAIAFEGGYSRMAHRHYSGTVWSNWVESITTGNTSANVQTMLSSADNTAIRSNIGAAKQVVVRTVSTSTHNFDIADESAYHRFVFNGAKTATIRPTGTHSLGTWWSAAIRVVGTGNLTLTPGDVSVTINPPYGGSLVMEPGMTATLIKVGISEYDLIGQTVPA